MMANDLTRMPRWFKRAAYCGAILLAVIILTGCGANPQPAAATPTTAPATATIPPTIEPTVPPTATTAPTATLEPTATPTLPPTATPVPPLAVLPDGFKAWCAPESYAGVAPTSPDAPADARLLTVKNDHLQVQIPAAYCTVVFQLNQAAPADLQVKFYDGNTAFMSLPLKPVEGHPDQLWTTVNHPYVINPPFWSVSYRLALAGADGKELWTNPVDFAKALPPTCIYTNKLPDPVTGWCPVSDPWEIEPHPDATYPYDRNRLLTPPA